MSAVRRMYRSWWRTNEIKHGKRRSRFKVWFRDYRRTLLREAFLREIDR